MTGFDETARPDDGDDRNRSEREDQRAEQAEPMGGDDDLQAGQIGPDPTR